MTKIKDATLDEIAALLITADQELTSFSWAIREAVPELLKRAMAGKPLDVATVAAWLEGEATDPELAKVRVVLTLIEDATIPTIPTIPAEPKPPTAQPATGRDRIDQATPKRTVVLNPGDNHMTALGGTITDTRVIVNGDVGRIKIGGNGLKMEGGVSEIVGTGTGIVNGIKLDGDPKGQLRIGEGLYVQPEAKADGSSMGDFAPIRGMAAMPNMHLVLDNALLTAPESWTGYDGFGMKWAMWIKGCRLTVLDTIFSAAREHSVYGHNMLDVWIEGSSNTARLVGGKPLGNGRTFIQFTNRIPIGDREPGKHAKGGDPATGSIVFKNCTSNYTGWEGLLDKIDPTGQLDPLNYGKGGGAAYTVAGHTGDFVRIEGCHSQMPYAAGIAVYVDQAKKKLWAELSNGGMNPLGYRSWMIDEAGKFFDPTRDDILPESTWATNRLEIVGYTQSRFGSRVPVSVAGVRTFAHDSSPNDAGTILDYLPGLRVVEQVEVIS